jgi:serine/threonine protein kinase
MKYMRGGSLRVALQGAAGAGIGLLPAIDIGSEAADGLGYAHRIHGIIHRDLKPENIFAEAGNDNDYHTKILDFSVMHVQSLPRITRRAVAVGTPLYMAPEQLRGEVPTPQTDIYGLGIVLYELVTGRTPFNAASVEALGRQILHASPPSMDGDVPAWFRKLVFAMLNKNPADRPSSMDDVAKTLRQNRPKGQAHAAFYFARIVRLSRT